MDGERERDGVEMVGWLCVCWERGGGRDRQIEKDGDPEIEEWTEFGRERHTWIDRERREKRRERERERERKRGRERKREREGERERGSRCCCPPARCCLPWRYAALLLFHMETDVSHLNESIETSETSVSYFKQVAAT